MDPDSAHKLVHALNFMRMAMLKETGDASIPMAMAILYTRISQDFAIGRASDDKFCLGRPATIDDEKDFDWMKHINTEFAQGMLKAMVNRLDEPEITSALIKATSRRLQGT